MRCQPPRVRSGNCEIRLGDIMGLFGKKSRGPTIPISEYSENALKRYRPWLLDHYETKAEIALQSNEGWEKVVKAQFFGCLAFLS